MSPLSARAGGRLPPTPRDLTGGSGGGGGGDGDGGGRGDGGGDGGAGRGRTEAGLHRPICRRQL